VSKKREYFPAVGTIAGAQGRQPSSFATDTTTLFLILTLLLGSDKMLIELAKGALLKAGKPLKVNTGATMFKTKILASI
jgi:hypothetical protein